MTSRYLVATTRPQTEPQSGTISTSADLANAHVAALRRLQVGKTGGAFNLGTGRGYSVREVLEAISRETGGILRTPLGLRREGDPAELVADASLGRSELGWRPQHSDLETIVRTAWAWHKRAHPWRGSTAAQLGHSFRPSPKPYRLALW